MKLGNKQAKQNLRNAAPRPPDTGGQFGNVEHVRNAPSFHYPSDNHHPAQDRQSSLSHPQNRTHHYFSTNQKDFFYGGESDSRSYFDNVGPASLQPQQQASPPISASEQPQSLPPEQTQIPSTLYFQDPGNNRSQQQPQTISYFQMQDPMVENSQHFNNKNNMTSHTQPPSEGYKSQRRDNGVHVLPDCNDRTEDERGAPDQNDIFEDKNKEFVSDHKIDDRPSHFKREVAGPDYPHTNETEGETKSLENITERSGPQGFEDLDSRTSWNRSVPHGPPPAEVEFLEAKDPKKSPPRRDNRSDFQEWPTPQHPFNEKPASRERMPPPPAQMDLNCHERSGSQPPQTDRQTSRDRSLPPPPLQNDNGGRDQPVAQSIYAIDRPSSQGWTDQYPSDKTGALEKVGHQRTHSLGSDRSGSLGRERSGSDRSGPSLPGRSTDYRKDPPRGVNRGDFNSTSKEPTVNRNNHSIARPDGVPSRSPGAGEDRSSPPSRPDNLESLPPESHLTRRMKHMSLQPSSFDKVFFYNNLL